MNDLNEHYFNRRFNSSRRKTTGSAMSLVGFAFALPWSPMPTLSHAAEASGSAINGGHMDAQLVPPRPVLSSEDIKSMLRDPKTPAALLMNMKVIVDNNLLLQPAFFSDAVLYRCFGGSRVTWDSIGAPHIPPNSRGQILFDDYPFHGMKVNLINRESGVERHRASADVYLSAHAKRSGFVDMHLSRAVRFAITVRTVRNIFGPQLNEVKDMGFATDAASVKPTYIGSLVYGPGENNSWGSRIKSSSIAFNIGKASGGKAPGRGVTARRELFVGEDQVEQIVISQVER